MLKKIIILVVFINIALVCWFFRDFFLGKFLISKNFVVEPEVLIQEKENIVENKEEIEKKPLENYLAQGEIKMVLKVNDNKLIFYNQNNFLETDLEGSYKKTLSSFPFFSLKTLKCSQTGNFCLIWNGNNFSVYNLNSKQNFELGENLKEVEFNSLGDGLVYLFFKGNSYELNTSDLEGKNWIKLDTIDKKNLAIEVSHKENAIVYFSQNATKEESGLFLTHLTSKELAQKISENNIIDAKWSFKGDKILFSFYDYSTNTRRVQLGYYDLIQKKQYNLGLPGIAQKCTWSEESSDLLYCASLTSPDNKEFNLENWEKRDFISQDVFWKIDLRKGEKEKIFTDLEKYPPVDAFNLILVENSLIFIDKISGSLIKRNF